MSDEKNPKTKNRNLGYPILTGVFAVTVLVVAFLFSRLYFSGLSDETGDKTYDRYYVMITDDYKSSFWQSVYSGAKSKALENNVYVELFGSNLSIDLSVEELMEIATSSHVDGIMVTGDTSDELTALIDEASDRGIPVVTMYSDNAASKRCSFVGVSGYSIGQEYGHQIINVLNEKKRIAFNSLGTDTFGSQDLKVTILVDSNMAAYGQNVILSGIQDVLSKDAPGTSFSLTSVAVDNSSPFSVEESVRDVVKNDEVPDVLVCLSELDTTCAYQAVIDYTLVGNVYILGYHNSEKVLNAINRNVVYSTIAIDTEELGQYCVEALEDYNETGNTSQYYAADVTLIDRNNVYKYLQREEESDAR